jgi:hypothetical protein
MALLEDDQKRVLIGIGIGLAAAGLIKGLIPSFRGVGRPLAKATIKSGLALIDKGREKAAEFGEAFEDLVAEARAEIDAERQGSHEAPPTEPGTVN